MDSNWTTSLCFEQALTIGPTLILKSTKVRNHILASNRAFCLQLLALCIEAATDHPFPGPDWNSFENGSWKTLRHNSFFFSKFGTTSLLDVEFAQNSAVPQDILDTERNLGQSSIEEDSITLLFGSETVGLHKLIGTEKVNSYPTIFMPMLNTGHRVDDTPSFNLAASVAMGLWEAYRQNHKRPLIRENQL